MPKQATSGKRRTLSEKQLAALSRGRAKRDANREERAASSPATVSTASRQPRSAEPGVLPPEIPVDLPRPSQEPDSSIRSSAPFSGRQPDAEPGSKSSTPKPRPRTTAETLNFAFSLGDEDEGTTTAPDGPTVDAEPRKATFSDGLKGIFESAARLGDEGERERKSRRVLAHDRLEDDVTLAAGEWAPFVAGLFMLLMGRIVGAELAPSYEMAGKVTTPLLRIAARHVDPMRELSPDATDMLAAAGAMSIYLQAIYPYWKQARADRRATLAREKVRVLNARPHTQPTPVPVQRAAPSGAAEPASETSVNRPVDAGNGPAASPGLAQGTDDPGIQKTVVYTPAVATRNGGLDAESILQEAVGVF